MGEIIYVTGGARSGKSTFGEKYVKDRERNKEKIYIATAYTYDDEMRIRVEKHREQRGEGWKTIENYKNLSEKIEEIEGKEKIILLDCITNLVTNFMLEDLTMDWEKIDKRRLESIEKDIIRELKNLMNYVRKRKYTLILVSNEVGMGIVPENALARHFRDVAGRVNQNCARESDKAYLIVSGLKIDLK